MRIFETIGRIESIWSILWSIWQPLLCISYFLFGYLTILLSLVLEIIRLIFHFSIQWLFFSEPSSLSLFLLNSKTTLVFFHSHAANQQFFFDWTFSAKWRSIQHFILLCFGFCYFPSCFGICELYLNNWLEKPSIQ